MLLQSLVEVTGCALCSFWSLQFQCQHQVCELVDLQVIVAVSNQVPISVMKLLVCLLVYDAALELIAGYVCTCVDIQVRYQLEF